MTPEELDRFHAGDERLFQRLVDDHSPRLMLVARAFARSEDEAREILQATWVRAYRKRRAFRGAGGVFGWLCAVCRTVALNRLRSGRRRTRLADAVARSAANPAPGSGGDPAEHEEIRRRLLRALAALGERQRQVVTLRLIEERSVAETAAALGVAEGTVKATLHQAVRALRPMLEELRG